VFTTILFPADRYHSLSINTAKALKRDGDAVGDCMQAAAAVVDP